MFVNHIESPAPPAGNEPNPLNTGPVLSQCRDILTVDECADVLQICTKQVRKLAHCGALKHFRIGSAIRIPRTSVETYISQQMEAAS